MDSSPFTLKEQKDYAQYNNSNSEQILNIIVPMTEIIILFFLFNINIQIAYCYKQ